MGQHCTGQNSMQCCPKVSRQFFTAKILFNVVLILMGQHCTQKTLCNVVPEALDNIAQEKIQVMSSEQHLVSLIIYIYQFLHVKKYMRLSFLYYGNWLTN